MVIHIARKKRVDYIVFIYNIHPKLLGQKIRRNSAQIIIVYQ